MLDGFDFNLDFDNFSAFEIDNSEDFETRYIKPPKFHEIPESKLVYDKAEKLAGDIDITANSRHFVVVNGSFIFGDFIEALIVKKDYKVKTMTISTLSLSLNNIDSLANLLNWGYLQELNMIVSDYFFSHERKMLVDEMYKRLDKDNRFQLASASTHCKICIFETECGKKIVIHGSANLRSSSNIEQFVIEENQTLYDFNKNYQDAIIEKFQTIKKSVRGKELWQAVQTGQQEQQG